MKRNVSHALMEKMENIETLLLKLNAKIDNFLGFEDIDDEERKELEELREEIRTGDHASFEDVFGDQ